MRLRVPFFLALAGLVFLATGSAAQRAGKASAPRAGSDPWAPIGVASWALPHVLRGMQLEASSHRPLTEADSRLIGFSIPLYGAIKDALLVARLDALRPSRLEHLSAGRAQTRRRNIEIYIANVKKLDPLLDKVTPSPECSLCRPGAH